MNEPGSNRTIRDTLDCIPFAKSLEPHSFAQSISDPNATLVQCHFGPMPRR